MSIDNKLKCDNPVQPISIIKNDDEIELYNPDNLGILFIKKNNPFCLTVIKSEEDYDPSIYEQKEDFLGFGKDKTAIIQETDNENYIINQNTYNSICKSTNESISKAVNSACNQAVVSTKQINKVKIQNIKCCVDVKSGENCECKLKIDQTNNSFINMDADFKNNLMTKLSTDIKNNIRDEITRNIREEVLTNLTSDLSYERNSDIFDKILGFAHNSSDTTVQNKIKNMFKNENNNITNLNNLISVVIENSSLNDVINNVVSSASQYNYIDVSDSEFGGKGIDFLFSQDNTTNIISQAIIENNITGEIMNNIIGDLSSYEENNSEVKSDTKTDTKTDAKDTDSLFGSTPTIVILIVAIVIIVIVIGVISVMGGGAGGAGGGSGGIIKLIIGLIVLLIVAFGIYEIVKMFKSGKSKDGGETKGNNNKWWIWLIVVIIIIAILGIGFLLFYLNHKDKVISPIVLDREYNKFKEDLNNLKCDENKHIQTVINKYNKNYDNYTTYKIALNHNKDDNDIKQTFKETKQELTRLYKEFKDLISENIKKCAQEKQINQTQEIEHPTNKEKIKKD